MKTWVLRPADGNAGSSSFDPRIQIRRWWVVSSLLVVGVTGFFIYQNRSGTQVLSARTTRPSVEESALAEKQFPIEHVTGQIKMRRNFIDEIVVEGSLRNIAKSTVYKDVVLRIDYLSKSGATLFTKDYCVCEMLTPNVPAEFKFKNPSTKDVDRVSAKILKAEPCN